MSEWMEKARATALAQDQAWKQNSYAERIRRAGEYARRKNRTTSIKIESEPVTAQKTEKPKLPKIETSPYLGLSDNLKQAGEGLAEAVNAGLSNSGEFANNAVKKLRDQGLTEIADGLKSQLDARERERHITELKANREEQKQVVSSEDAAANRGATNPNYTVNRNEEMTDFQRQLAKMKADTYQWDVQREADKKELQSVEDRILEKHLQGINARDQGDTDAFNAAYADYGQLKQQAAELKQKIDPSSAENGAKWEWEMAKLLESTGEPAEIRRVYDQSKQLQESYTTDMIGSEERYWEEQAHRNDLRKLKEKYGKDTVEDWFAYYDRVGNRRKVQEMAQDVEEDVQNNTGAAVGHNAASIGANFFSGFGYLDAATQNLHRKLTGSRVPVDYNAGPSVPSHYVSAVRGSTAEVIEQATEGKRFSDTCFGNLYSQGYQTGMSMLDTLAAVAVGKGLGAVKAAPALLYGASLDSHMRDALSRGATDDQAQGYALLAGSVDFVLDKLSFDSLIKLKSPSLLVNMLKQGGVGASEGALSSSANEILDLLVMGDKSRLKLDKRLYEELDFSPAEAEKLALRDFRQRVLTEAFSEAVSGMVLGGIKTGYDAYESWRSKTVDQTTQPSLVFDVSDEVATDAKPGGINTQRQTERAIRNFQEFAKNDIAPKEAAGIKAYTPLLLPEQSEIAKQRGYPYEKVNTSYGVVEVPQEMVSEIKRHIDMVSEPEAKKIHKKLLKDMFMGETYTSANTQDKKGVYNFDVSSRGIGEIINRQPVNAQTYAMLEYLDRVLENSKYNASEPTSHKERRGVMRTDLFETDTLVGDQSGKAKLRANITKEGKKLYFATNQTTEDTPSQPWADNGRHHGIEKEASAADPIVPAFYKAVKVDDIDLSKVDLTTREKIWQLRRAYEAFWEELARKELKKLLNNNENSGK